MLFQRQASEERDEHIDLTPMVDVVFQLMTFMLFSIQLTGSELNVPPAKHGVGLTDEGTQQVWLMRPTVPGGESRLIVGDAPDGPSITQDQLKKAIAAGVAQGLKNVVLQADGDVPHGDVLKTLSTIKEVENVSASIGVQEPD